MIKQTLKHKPIKPWPSISFCSELLNAGSASFAGVYPKQGESFWTSSLCLKYVLIILGQVPKEYLVWPGLLLELFSQEKQHSTHIYHKNPYRQIWLTNSTVCTVAWTRAKWNSFGSWSYHQLQLCSKSKRKDKSLHSCYAQTWVFVPVTVTPFFSQTVSVGFCICMPAISAILV